VTRNDLHTDLSNFFHHMLSLPKKITSIVIISNVTNLTRLGDNTVEMWWEMLQQIISDIKIKRLKTFISYCRELLQNNFQVKISKVVIFGIIRLS